MSIRVNVDNFVRAETDRMFADLQRDAGGVNLLLHNREPAAIDRQTVIRLNRDTLYSFAVVDLSEGATLTLPEHGDRYVSAMVVNRDHFVGAIYHDAGEYRLTATEFGSQYVVVAVRTLVDPANPADLEAAAAVQDGISIRAGSARPFATPEYDTASLDATRAALLQLAAGLTGFDSMFGSPDQVTSVRHLIGTAAGWGGLPSAEATYIGVAPEAGAENYELTLKDVPVDGFWSVSVYNAAGYFEPNDRNAYSVNSVTGISNDDGSVTVRFGDFPDGTPNAVPTTEGWNFLVRLYRPRPAVSDGTWQLPELQPAR
ncbi:DUF1214 domain-containing protein [Prescottella equi]|uniref:DUF1214 domain-containing protein n=1 Tax=Rhodococcus hoagii TaxID=43767 RepID=UPI000A11794D|nr:DUF1214 domain-containing protein [Prescottella equi]NKR41602.1 DUF1214 domain-containing protein [Prescottella equi]ORJ94255.1 carboxylesterase [Prescottella equi]